MQELSELNELRIEGSLARRELLKIGGVAGLGLLGAGLLAGCGGSHNSSSSSQDGSILNAALTAEQLATTMYYYIVTTSGGVYSQLSGNTADQAYLVGGYQEELNHANFLKAQGATALASTFYFPTNMFTDPQTTANTLVLLEDAFIAAYLIGVRDFSSSALKVIAAQIMGIEAEHRVLGRVIANDLNLTSVTGLAGSESLTPSNNLAYERTFSTALPNISAVVSALGPFVTPGATGFASTAYTFATAAAGSGITPVTLEGTTP